MMSKDSNLWPSPRIVGSDIEQDPNYINVDLEIKLNLAFVLGWDLSMF
jgi:hypothetical protein